MSETVEEGGKQVSAEFANERRRKTYGRQILILIHFLFVIFLIRVFKLDHVAVAVGSRVSVAGAVRGGRSAERGRDSPVEQEKSGQPRAKRASRISWCRFCFRLL